MGVQETQDIIDIIEKKRLQWYGHVKRMPKQRLPKLIERKKKGRPKKTWMEGVQEATTVRGLEADQWMGREEWRLVSGRQQKISCYRKYNKNKFMVESVIVLYRKAQQ